MARNIYQEVTARILAELEAGTVPWVRPWSTSGYGGMPRNAATQRAYSGANVVLLWSQARAAGYDAPLWLTFKQALDLGGHVRKGEKGQTVIYVSTVDRVDDDGKERRIPFLRAYTVFNVAQCENLPAKIVGERKPVNKDARDAYADAFLGMSGADIRHGSRVPITLANRTSSTFRISTHSRARTTTTRRHFMSWRTGPATRPVAAAI